MKILSNEKLILVDNTTDIELQIYSTDILKNII